MEDILKKMEVFQKELQKNGFKEQAERISQKQNDFNDPFMLMVVGEGNTGKSTLINSLFNKQVAPTSRIPKTWKIDIYENSNNEEALLYYKSKNKPHIVNLDNGYRICDEEENNIKNNEFWKSDLYQVKWRIKSDWIENILLIDTPGFSQFRSNSTYNNLNLFGTKGIQYQSFDGFEHYFYRADFIFWCIKATKLEDSDTLNALQSVNTEKANVKGIITFMERIPLNRWKEIKKKAEELYGAYIKEFLYFSPDSNIADLKQNDTIHEIKKYINEKVIKNLPELKKSSLINYYSEELHNYSKSLEKISNVYDKNINKYFILIDNINKEFGLIQNRIGKEHKRIFDSITSQLEYRLETIYLQSNGDSESFKYHIENELLNRYTIQKQIEPIYSNFREEISNLNLSISRKLIWDMITISNNKAYSNTNLVSYSHSENIINSYNSSSDLGIDLLFEGFDGFNIAVGGIAAAIGLFALGPIGLIAGAIGFLFGESKQNKVVRKAKEEILKYIEQISTKVINEMVEINVDYKNQFIEQVKNSFQDFNGNSKDDILMNFYRTDSILSNQLYIGENGAIIDCLNDKKQLLTYFPKLLKYDGERKLAWDRNANILFAHEVENIFKKIKDDIFEKEQIIKQLILDSKLSDLSLFNKELSSIEKYFTSSILSNPFLPSKSFIEKLIFADGNKVLTTSDSYNGSLTATRAFLYNKKTELQTLWNQKALDLIWETGKNDLLSTLTSTNSKFSSLEINKFCEYKSKLLFENYYSSILKKTKLFDNIFEVKIGSTNLIYSSNIVSNIKSSLFPFKEQLRKIIENNITLASLRTFDIPDIAKFIDDKIQRRLIDIIDELPPSSSMDTSYKRYIGRIVLSCVPLFIMAANYMYPFNFINDQQTSDTIQLVLNSKISLIVFSFIFLLLIIFQILSRLRMKKNIKNFISKIFTKYGVELYIKIQTRFIDRIQFLQSKSVLENDNFQIFIPNSESTTITNKS